MSATGAGGGNSGGAVSLIRGLVVTALRPRSFSDIDGAEAIFDAAFVVATGEEEGAGAVVARAVVVDTEVVLLLSAVPRSFIIFAVTAFSLLKEALSGSLATSRSKSAAAPISDRPPIARRAMPLRYRAFSSSDCCASVGLGGVRSITVVASRSASENLDNLM